jgi:hypothetical protein
MATQSPLSQEQRVAEPHPETVKAELDRLTAGFFRAVSFEVSKQFVATPEGWKTRSMAWDDERPGLSILKDHEPGSAGQ